MLPVLFDDDDDDDDDCPAASWLSSPVASAPLHYVACFPLLETRDHKNIRLWVGYS